MRAPTSTTSSDHAETADAIVVGAGVIGCSVALSLARSGRRVVVVDKSVSAGAETTSASSTVVRFHYSTFEGVALAQESMRRWCNWVSFLGVSDEFGHAEFHQVGAIVYEAPNFPSERVRALFTELGVQWEDWSPEQSRIDHPVLDPSQFWPPKPVTSDEFFADPTGDIVAIYTPEGGYINDPRLASHNLMVAAQHHGAQFRFRQAVTDVLRDGECVAGVRLASGEIVTAAIVVNCAGPWSTQLNEIAGVTDDMNVSTRPLRQEVHVVPAPEGFRMHDGGMCITDADLGTYFRPESGGTVLIGGLEPECDPLHWLDIPEDANPFPTPEGWESNVYRMARRMPSVQIPNAPVGLGSVYDVTDDWIPIYDASSLAGFYMAVGTSGNQFKNAPVVGDLMTAIIDAVESGHAHDDDPVQFTLQHSGRSINLGHYSRLRVPNPNSTNSVLG